MAMVKCNLVCPPDYNGPSRSASFTAYPLCPTTHPPAWGSPPGCIRSFHDASQARSCCTEAALPQTSPALVGWYFCTQGRLWRACWQL